MNQNLLHQQHLPTKLNHRGLRGPHNQPSQNTNAVLREIAFVLKMTQKVRAEIKTKSTIPETANA